MLHRITGFVSVLSLSLIVSGCAPDDNQNTGVPVMTDGLEHNHGHSHGGGGHPETLGDAIHALTELRDTVRDAFANNDTETAHGPLHDVGHLLEEVSELGGEADLSEEAKATIETNVEALLDAFGAVDRKMHSGDESEGSDYKDVSEKIDAAIAAITEAAGPAISEHSDEGHDDEDGHHEHHDDDHDHKEEHHDDDDHDHEDGEKKEPQEDSDGEKAAE